MNYWLIKSEPDVCRYDGEGKNEKDGNIIPDGSGNFSNIVIESFIPPNPNPSSEDDFDFQIFVTETLCIAEGTCQRYVRPRVPIISVADIEPEPEVNENNRNVRTRNGFNFISFEPPSQNWNFNNNYISFALRRESTSPELNRIHHGYYEGQRMEVVDVKKDDVKNCFRQEIMTLNKILTSTNTFLTSKKKD